MTLQGLKLQALDVHANNVLQQDPDLWLNDRRNAYDATVTDIRLTDDFEFQLPLKLTHHLIINALAGVKENIGRH